MSKKEKKGCGICKRIKWIVRRSNSYGCAMSLQSYEGKNKCECDPFAERVRSVRRVHARTDRIVCAMTFWLEGKDAPSCECCCSEHTYGAGCPAYQYGYCRGQDSVDYESWKRHYAKYHQIDLDTGEAIHGK